MDSRDCILISWSARDIEAFVFPVIEDLSPRFKIIVLVLNISLSDELLKKLDLMQNKKMISGYHITPEVMSGLSFHLYLKRTMKLLQNSNIALWLCSSDMGIAEKYIAGNLIQTKTKIICLCNQLTFLFTRNPSLAKTLLSNHKLSDELIVATDSPKVFVQRKFRGLLNRKNFLRGFFSYVYSKKLVILRYTYIVVYKKIQRLLNRYIYPFLMVGKFYAPNKIEDLTQLSDGHASAYIFFDKFEVEAHKSLFKNKNIYLAGVNRIEKNIRAKNKVLGIISGWTEHSLLDKQTLEMYVNDFIKVCKLYKTTSIDLRPHPSMDTKNNYAFQIAHSLKNQGFVCEVTTCESSVITQSMNYVCIAGFASTALRDVRLFNSSIGIVAFELVSKKYFDLPRFAFGSSDGIDWITAKGDYAESKKFNAENRLLVSEVITRVYEN
tara:strand:+ start:1182 stop:2492 length:1311 start_codon:yes stop_codon:yes gene_type:complete